MVLFYVLKNRNREQSMSVEVGKKIPDFSALSNKEAINSKDYHGKYLVLYFYPKDNTSGCTVEAVGFKDLYSKFKAVNAEIIGVSRDSIESHVKFECKHQLPFPLISDSDSKICNIFGVLKSTPLIKSTPLGLIRSTFLIGPNGTLLQEWRSVKVADHAQQVLMAINQNINN